MYRLFMLDNETARRRQHQPMRSPKTCYRLSADDGVLWSIGAKDVLAFDGKTWTRIN